ncbi:hypothetical protein GC176_07590 [bacterium]|nr:hypothetical protein [bacterium]
MWNLYGIKRDQRNLVATFDTEAQLRSYVQWAILKRDDDGSFRFEQKTPLTGCTSYDFDDAPLDSESAEVVHNPTPGML